MPLAKAVDHTKMLSLVVAVPLTKAVSGRDEAQVNATHFTKDARLLLHLAARIAQLAVSPCIHPFWLVLRLLRGRGATKTCGFNFQ